MCNTSSYWHRRCAKFHVDWRQKKTNILQYFGWCYCSSKIKVWQLQWIVLSVFGRLFKFSKTAQDFDDTKLQSLSEKYANFFDCVKLKLDPIGLYSSQTVRSESKIPSQLLSSLYQNELIQTVPEMTKLLKLVLTITATTASVERFFSALKRIKTYNRKRTEEERLSSLATIAIEKERPQKLRHNKGDF